MNIVIREPFWGAYKKFGWGARQWGVGISSKTVADAEKLGEDLSLKIWSFPDTYKVSPQKVREFATKTKSTMRAKNVELYIVPESLLEK